MIKDEIKEIILKEKDLFEAIIGQEETKKQLKSALIMGRHAVILGSPGIGKTTLAKCLINRLKAIKVKKCLFNCLPKEECALCKNTKELKTLNPEERFVRIQGSPDLTAEDLIGDIDPLKALKFGPMSIEAFTPGKIFRANHGILFFDEINRCSEKLQNALLQVMQERKATIGSYDVDLPANFALIATMNPEDSSTEKLSDVLLDRFDLIYMGYPEVFEYEFTIVEKYGQKEDVKFPKELISFLVHFIRFLREDKDVVKKPSVRATIGLYERAQANAIIEGKKKVSYKDIQDCIMSVLSHRISLKPSVQYLKTPRDYLKEKLKEFIDTHKEIADDASKSGESP